MWFEIFFILGFIFLMFLSGLEIDFFVFVGGNLKDKKVLGVKVLNVFFIFILVFVVIFVVLLFLFYVFVWIGFIDNVFLMMFIIFIILLGVVVLILKDV